MARVVFPDHLLGATGGEREVAVIAENYRELVEKLEARWPGIGERLSKSAVAIDGQIYQDAFLEPIEAASEVFFMPRIEGG
ncbi:MAG: MoaD/ThiS family protein [Gammaproteobacteria bacterium]|nr:MoaD/ThiS family protein [Gammaproteobacteria bacterium]